MKFKLLVLSIFYSCIQLFGQSYQLKGHIRDAETKRPLPFVNIIVPKTQSGTSTDIDGNFSIHLSVGSHSLQISYLGYERKTIEVNQGSKNLNIELMETSEQLQEVEIKPGLNPAHRIIKNATAHKALNAPENLPSFSYRSYSKFAVTVEGDTTIQKGEDSAETLSDSASERLLALMEKQHIFFMETVSERNYLPPNRDNETVLASRTSGFKNPLFSILVSQLQSFSFYGDFIALAGEEYLNPISKGSTNRYHFILEDTTYNSPTDTVYIISFRPRPNYGFKPMKGTISINTRDWAIQNVIAEPVEEIGTKISIEQRYKEYAPHIWFPDQLNARVEFGNVLLNNLRPIAYARTYLSDVVVDKELSRKDISRATLTIAEDAGEEPEKLLRQYRTDSISETEKRTYHFMDSVSEEENFDRLLDITMALASGKIPLGPVNFDLNRLLSYNDYEGIRLGAGLHSSKRISEYFTIGGYFGYGFKDEVWKYGWDAEWILNKDAGLSLYGGYLFDIFESGGQSFIAEKPKGIFENNYRRLFIRQWDEASRYYGGLKTSITPSISFKTSLQRENRLTVGNYWFKTGDQLFENGFTYTEIIGGIEYMPFREYIEGAGLGQLDLNRSYPVIKLQYSRGINNLWGSEFDYNKFDLSLSHRIKTVRIGTFEMDIKGGKILEDLPYAKLYVATANQIDEAGFWNRAQMVADRNSFETMRFNEFVSDSYIQLMLRHDFKSLLFRRENFAPHIEWVGRALWGSLRSPEFHRGVSVKDTEKGYYESGIEINRLLTGNFLNLGLGFYYRIGPYSLPDFGQNLAIKITSKYIF